MKKLLFSIFLAFTAISVFAQTDDELFGGFDDDELFFVSDDDDLFGGDDDFFTDDGIDEITNVKADSDLSKGLLFENGSIKIGGNFSTSIGTSTILYTDTEKSFGDNLKDTILTPAVSAYLTVDARPNQNLRMYTKFGLAYPFETKVKTTEQTMEVELYGNKYYLIPENSIISDWFKLKEIFTDFSVADRAYFRFGLHTVTWGAGYFFSPVSDMINTSSINPEDTSAQVDGSLNLRTQITFPDSQNCLWFYVIPSTNFNNSYTTETYVKDTALAGKYDLLLGNWEFGLGGFYKYNQAPKAMLTATGSLRKISLFGEFVYQYGSDSEWTKNTDWDDKTSIFQATAGFSYMWKTPAITLAAQYYYDGNDKDIAHQYFTKGHNVAAVANFGRIFGTTDVTATVFGMVNFGKEDIPEMYKAYLSNMGISSYLNTATFSAMLNYSPVSEITMGFGPYVTFVAWDEAPVVSMKLNFTLGGGKF